MVDLHSHLIFSVDDGSENIDESIRIIEEAYKSGVDKIIATPHYLFPEFISPQNENINYLNLLKDEVIKRKIDIELFLGNEVYLSTEIADDYKERKNICFK